ANPLIYFSKKASEYSKLHLPSGEGVLISTQSATDMQNIPSNSIDYIFIDPPFGANIQYSELNSVFESWLRVFTNDRHEAIISTYKEKYESEYHLLMERSFNELYRVLKPGRWITVEFHSSAAAIWNLIQDALARAGFVVAQVAILDKQKGTINQLTSPASVNNDLVINAYKPRLGFLERFYSKGGLELESEFVRQHLSQLPITANVERSREMIYSKYLAYYVQHGYQVAYNAEQFYRALSYWGFVERDNYWFADEAQANEYEKRKLKNGKTGPSAQAVLFISDERSARQWLWSFLDAPKSYDQIYTAFVKALQTSEDEIPELKVMLEEGFVRTNGDWKRPDSLTQAELEERRQARLLRQFEEYLESAQAGRILKEVRKEALVAGFTEAYREGRFQDILRVGRKLPQRLLESSPDIFDFIDIAETKVES
ncbi:MAG: site-specific DNA-methyltransferase, partial [Anaerolineales bacterium]|nr:site-specific DNA-methyltransferase [Anaerolineales bacterium]